MCLFVYARIAPVAILVTVVCMLPLCLISLKASSPTSIEGQESQDREMTFKNLLSGSGRTEDGSRFSFGSAEASDGVKISARTERRSSVSRAKAVLKRTLRGAEIVTREPKINNQGQKVGERVVAHFASKAQNKSRYALLWTDGSDFHYLQSSSLRHLLAYERRY